MALDNNVGPMPLDELRSHFPPNKPGFEPSQDKGPPHLSATGGSGENRTNTYTQYAEEESPALPAATERQAKNAGGVASSTGQQDGTVQRPLKFFHDGPLFGLDIGYSSLKVMQIDLKHGDIPKVIGYGVSDYYPTNTISKGEILDHQTLAQKLNEMFAKRLIGSINTRMVACTIPTSYTFSRTLRLPKMEKEHLAEAVRLEAEQYIPLPADKLYIDYEILSTGQENIDLLVVACPKNIIESYMKFLNIAGLEPVALEPTMNAATRLFGLADPSHNKPSLLIDVGSVATDIAVYDQVMTVNSTLPAGSDNITALIARRLGVNTKQAYVIKNQHGIAYSDKLREISEALMPLLNNLVREARKILRYYEERSAHHQKVAQIILIGGGATMPGLSEYISKEMGLPAKRLDPWRKIDFDKLGPPAEFAKSMYITVAGEAVLNSREVFK